jgi:hypothetical protein
MADSQKGGRSGAVILGLILGAAVLHGSHHGHHGGILAHLTSSHHGHVSGSAGCRKLEHLWIAAGGRPAAAQTAASIAMVESSGQQYASNYNTNGTVDRGYWQINSIHGSQSTFNPKANARAAVAISGDGSNWSPWVTFTTGTYAGRC